MKKNLFNIYKNNSSSVNGSQVQETCEPCSLECEKMNMKINNRKLSDIINDEVLNILTPFKYWHIFLFNDCAQSLSPWLGFLPFPILALGTNKIQKVVYQKWLKILKFQM